MQRNGQIINNQQLVRDLPGNYVEFVSSAFEVLRHTQTRRITELNMKLFPTSRLQQTENNLFR